MLSVGDQRGHCDVGEHLRADARRPLVHPQVSLVQVVRRAAGSPRPEPRHRPRDPVEVPAEVLAAQALVGGHGAEVAEDLAHGPTQQPVGDLFVDHGRHALLVVHVRVDAVGADDVADQLADQRLALGPGHRVEDPDGAGRHAAVRDHVDGGAGRDDPPDQADARARVEAARQHRGKLGEDLGQREGEVAGQVRARGVPARPLEAHLEPVGGAGERAGPQAHLADVDARVAVQGEDPLHVLEHPEAHQVQGAPGHDLLGRLEEQPDPAGQQPAGMGLGQGEPGPDQRGGVHVVAAGVGDAGSGAGPRVGRGVLDGQGVEVGAQRDDTVALADLGDQPGLGQARDPPPGLGHPGGHDRGGPVLGPRQLGVRVQVAAQLDELGVVLLDDGVDQRGRIGGVGGVCGHRDEVSSRSRRHWS